MRGQTTSVGPSPARWAAAGVLGGASVVGMLWALIGRAPAPIGGTISAARPVQAAETLPGVPSPVARHAEPPIEWATGRAAQQATQPVAVVTTGTAPAEQVDRAASESVPGEGPEPDTVTVTVPDPVPTPSQAPAEPAPMQAAPAAPETDGPARTESVSGVRLNINEASRAELELLPRIGPTLAQRIIDYRESEGPFRSLTHLTEVKGIGVRTVERLEPYVRFD